MNDGQWSDVVAVLGWHHGHGDGGRSVVAGDGPVAVVVVRQGEGPRALKRRDQMSILDLLLGGHHKVSGVEGVEAAAVRGVVGGAGGRAARCRGRHRVGGLDEVMIEDGGGSVVIEQIREGLVFADEGGSADGSGATAVGAAAGAVLRVGDDGGGAQVGHFGLVAIGGDVAHASAAVIEHVGLRDALVVAHASRGFGERVRATVATRHSDDGAVGVIREKLLVVGVVVLGIAAVTIGHSALGFVFCFTKAATTDNQKQKEEEDDGNAGSDDDRLLLVSDGGLEGAGVIEGHRYDLLHDTPVVLGHAQVLAQVIIARLGDGQIVPSLDAIRGQFLLMKEVGLFGEGGVVRVVVHDAAVDNPASLRNGAAHYIARELGVNPGGGEHTRGPYLDDGLASELRGQHLVPHLVGEPGRLCARRRLGVELLVDDPVAKVLELAVAIPRVRMQREGLEIVQGHKDLVAHLAEVVGVQVDGLDGLAEVLEGRPVHRVEFAVREVDGFEAGEGWELVVGELGDVIVGHAYGLEAGVAVERLGRELCQVVEGHVEVAEDLEVPEGVLIHESNIAVSHADTLEVEKSCHFKDVLLQLANRILVHDEHLDVGVQGGGDALEAGIGAVGRPPTRDPLALAVHRAGADPREEVSRGRGRNHQDGGGHDRHEKYRRQSHFGRSVKNRKDKKLEKLSHATRMQSKHFENFKSRLQKTNLFHQYVTCFFGRF